MPLNIELEVAAMQRTTVNQLRAKYAEVFGEQSRSRHKEYLIKRIAWRMQANAEGGLSERALRRATELADEAELRLTAPRTGEGGANATVVLRMPVDKALPKCGDEITREYKGHLHIVRVRENGFEHDGTLYKSLSAVAKAITGKHWNGYHFFGLRKKGGSR